MKTIEYHELLLIKAEYQEMLGYYQGSGIGISFKTVSENFGEEYIDEFCVSIGGSGEKDLGELLEFAESLQLAKNIIIELNDKYAGAKIEY